MAFFAVWTVHHHTEDSPEMARTQRSKLKNILTFSMFYHLEHMTKPHYLEQLFLQNQTSY